MNGLNVSVRAKDQSSVRGCIFECFQQENCSGITFYEPGDCRLVDFWLIYVDKGYKANNNCGNYIRNRAPGKYLREDWPIMDKLIFYNAYWQGNPCPYKAVLSVDWKTCVDAKIRTYRYPTFFNATSDGDTGSQYNAIYN